MKLTQKTLFILILLSSYLLTLNATVYENAEDNSINRWTIVDNQPTGAVIENIYDTTVENRVINLQGNSYDNAYMIGNTSGNTNSWNNTQEFFLFWKLKNNQGFIFDVIINTQNGLRYLRYTDNDSDLGIEDTFIINHGLGYSAANGQWNNFTRDLNADLLKFEPNNQLISVDGIIIRGDCKVDNIEVLSALPEDKEFILYEDAEDGTTNRWTITDNGSGTSISNIQEANNKVIQLQSNDSYGSQYKLNFNNNRNNTNLRWDMKTTEGFIIDISVMTLQGERFLRYSDTEIDVNGIDGDILFFGLGYSPTNGQWHTIVRELEKDLKQLEPSNQLISVESFLIRANSKLDNIELYTDPIKVYENAEDGTTNNWSIYSGSNSATISNIQDANLNSKVISFSGDSYAHQYIIGGDYVGEANAWNDTKHKHIQWSIKNSNGFVIVLVVNSSNGVRFINYFDASTDIANIDGETLNYGLGENASNDKWHTYIRDIEKDLQKLEPNNTLLSVEGFIVIGDMKLDNLELFSILHPVTNQAGVAITFDDTTIDSWFAFRNKFLKYDAKVTFFVSHFFGLDTEQINKLKILEADGSEIGCHTYNHKGVQKDFNGDVSRINEYIEEQIRPASDLMIAAGFNPVSFAYPYGEHQTLYDEAVRAFFPYIRLTYDDFQNPVSKQENVYHSSNSNYIILGGAGIDKDFNNSVQEITEGLIKARKNGQVLTLYAHDIINDPNKLYNITPKNLEKVMANAKNLGLKFYTYKEAFLVGNQN